MTTFDLTFILDSIANSAANARNNLRLQAFTLGGETLKEEIITDFTAFGCRLQATGEIEQKIVNKEVQIKHTAFDGGKFFTTFIVGEVDLSDGTYVVKISSNSRKLKFYVDSESNWIPFAGFYSNLRNTTPERVKDFFTKSQDLVTLIGEFKSK